MENVIAAYPFLYLCKFLSTEGVTWPKFVISKILPLASGLNAGEDHLEVSFATAWKPNLNFTE